MSSEDPIHVKASAQEKSIGARLTPRSLFPSRRTSASSLIVLFQTLSKIRRDAFSRQPGLIDKDLHVLRTYRRKSVQIEESSGEQSAGIHVADPTYINKGESDDDYEELLEAAKYARCASYHACSTPFWKKIEPIFASVSSDDKTYLHKQLNLEESDGTDFDVHNVLEDEQALPQTIASCQGLGEQLNGIGSSKLPTMVDPMKQSQGITSASEGLVAERSVENVPSLLQLLLTAIIVEDDPEGASLVNKKKHEMSVSPTEYHPSDESICTGVKHNVGDMMHIEAGESAKEPETILPSEVEKTSQSPHYNSKRPVSDIEYQSMSVEARCLWELENIGIFLEPCATEVDKDITGLMTSLHNQLREKRAQIYKLEDLVLAGEADEMDLEQTALNRLVEIAYRKCKAYSTSSKKTIKEPKQKALAFAERTIGRCREYEMTGTSCFSEITSLKDILSSTPPQLIDTPNSGEGKQHCPYCGRPPSIKIQSKPKTRRKRKASGNPEVERVKAKARGSSSSSLGTSNGKQKTKVTV